jgi:ADP-sugar diphosphatase
MQLLTKKIVPSNRLFARRTVSRYQRDLSGNTMATTSFDLPNTTSSIKVTHPTSLSQDQILKFTAFKTWLNTLQHSLTLQKSRTNHPFHKTPYSLKSIEIQTVDFFGGSRLGFLKLRAEVSNDEGEKFPGSVFLRGGSVAMLVILTPSSPPSDNATSSKPEEYAILTVQPRIPAGSLDFIELPAGMIDDSGTFAGAAAKEIAEETGLEISSGELIDLTQLTAQLDPSSSADEDGGGEDLQNGIYPSPGGSDEFIPIFMARKSLPDKEIEELRGKLTGLRDHGEKITLKIVRLEDVWKVAWRDGKTLAALALYQGLKDAGRI